MICVSIGRGRHKHLIAEHKHLVEQGAQLVELRLDYINGPVNLARLLPDRPGPVIVTVRRQRDGGKYNGDEDARMMLLRSAIADGVDYVDLEDDIADKIPRYGKTKRIVSLHDFRKTPENLEEIHARLAAKDADVVKLATLANRPHDCVRMLRLVKNSRTPTIGICMGEVGVATRVLSGRYGSPFTYATFHHERALAPGQLSFQQMREIYRYDRITPTTRLFGVIGDPIGHSLSPLIHNAAFEALEMDAVYVPFRVSREDLAQFIDDAHELELEGLSVTIPHKEATLKKMTKVDGAARGIGAVNTVVFQGDELVGYNTDYRAAMDSLAAAMEVQESSDQPRWLEGRAALVLGAGGAAKAIAYGLVRRGAEVVMASRTPQRAAQLASQFGCRSVEWAARHNVPADVIVNCTPLGMHPNVDETPFEKLHLRPSTIAFDTVYNPENTLFIKDAKGRGCKVVTGVEMFIRQAALQFKLFTGRDAPEELMHATLRRAIGPARI